MVDNGDMIIAFSDVHNNVPNMRVGSQGEVIWAKLLLLAINGFPCSTQNYKLGGHLIFKIDSCQFQATFVTVISKMDINGTFIGTYNLNIKMYKMVELMVFPLLSVEVSTNGNCIFGGPDGSLTLYLDETYSGSYSGNYSSVIRTDEFLNTIWYSSFQIGTNALNTILLLLDEDRNEVFIVTFNLKNIACFIALNYSSGIYKKSQCYQYLSFSSGSFGITSTLFMSIYPFNEDYFIVTDNDLQTYSYEVMINFKLENISVYRRNYTQDVNGFIDIDMFIYNPLNSSDCSTDVSCYIKTASNVLIAYDYMIIPPKIYFDQFNFNLNGSYCDPIYNASEFESDFDVNSIYTEIIDTSEKFTFLDYNIQFNVSSLSIHNSIDNNITLQYFNLDNEIWPSFYPQFYEQCKFDMPQFLLNFKQISFSVGTNINYEDNANQATTYYPFSHCRSTRFYLIACMPEDSIVNGSCTMPDWVAIDNEVKSFSVLLNQITSIKSKTLVLQAIIQEPFQIIDYAMFSSDQYLLSFEFTNENAHVSQFSSDAYVIINQLKNFTINFVDFEEDNILLKIVSPGSLNAYVQRYQSNNTFLLIVLADQGVNTETSITLNYTDSYHQDLQYWNNLTMNVFIYASNPPQYAAQLQNVSISACSCANFSLPTATDQDGDLFSVNLDNSAPDWIKLIDMNILFVCPPQSSIYKNMPAQFVNIVLLDATGAYSNNTFYVNIDTSMLVEFPIIKNISLHYSELYSMKLDVQSANDIHLADCTLLQTITWSSYNYTSKMLTIDGDNIELIGTHCVKILATNGCNNNITSNSFNATINPNKPPVFLDTIPPITLMKGQSKLTEFNKQIIYDENSKQLNYNLYILLNFKSNGYPKTMLTFNENMFYILVQGTIDGSFTAIFSVTDTFNQTAEITVSIIVYNCASKDCVKCTGIYQKDCTQCVDRYILDDQTKTCYFDYKYLSTGSSFYVFIGIAIFISILINMCFISKLKRLSLLSVKYVQVILIFLLSTNNIEPETYDLTILHVIFNFSFDFLSPKALNSWLSCHNESKKMQNLHFYCSSTLTNYKCAILVLLLIVFVYYFIKILISKVKWISSLSDFLKSLKCLRFITNIEITRYDVVWIVYNLILPFMMISLLSDMVNFKSHLVLSFASLLIVLAAILFSLFTKLKLLRPEFIVKIDPTNPFIYSYVDFIRSCVHCCLFVFGDDANYKAWMCIAFCVNVLMLFIQSSRSLRKKCRCELSENQTKEMTLHFYGESCTLFIIGIITVNRGFSSVSDQLSIKNTLKFVSCLILLQFVSILLISLIVLKNKEDPKLESKKRK